MMAEEPTDGRVFSDTYEYTLQDGKSLTVMPELAFYGEVRNLAGEPRLDLAIILKEAQTGEALATITVNFGDFIGIRNAAYIDTNNHPDIDRWLVDNGIAEATRFSRQSGYCIYPMVVFDEGLLKSIDDGKLAAYHSQYHSFEKDPDQAAWAICGEGIRGVELWFFEAHLIEERESPTGKSFYLASWNKDSEGKWGEYERGQYWDYAFADETVEAASVTLPFCQYRYKRIPYSDFEDVCLYGDAVKERKYTQPLGILAAEDRRRERSYEVTITETLKRTVHVKADSRDEAEQRAGDEWRSGVHVLDADDFAEVHFTVGGRVPDKGLSR
jgi:hypothetical protein